MSDLHDLHPFFGNGVYIGHFEEAYKLHESAGEVMRLANSPVEGLPPEQIAQRKALLQITVKLLIARRDSTLDDFCRAWLTYRGIVK